MASCDRQTDGRTPGEKQKSPKPKGGDMSDKTNDIGFVRIHPAFFIRPPKTLSRLSGCPECPKSSLSENSKWFVLSCLRKFYGHIS